MKTTLLILTLATFAGTSSLRAEEITRPPINPALLYWQAAALLPKFTDEQAKDLAAMASGQVAFDSAKAHGLLSGESSLRLMTMAADSAAPCDWGLPTEDGPEMELPHISKVREMANIAILKAEILFADGQTQEGVDWLLTVHRIARHAAVGDLLVSNLVQFLIEGSALRAAGRHCLGWDEQTRHSYAASLAALPTLHPTDAAYRSEHLFIDWIERKFNGTVDSKLDVEKMLSSLARANPQDKEALAADLKPGAMKAALGELDALQRRTVSALGKPWPQAETELKALGDEATRSSHFVVRVTYPRMVRPGQHQYAVATLRTMLDAALEHGPQLDAATAATYHDAFQGEPLLLKKAADGTLTLLTSDQHPDRKDLSLPLGK